VFIRSERLFLRPTWPEDWAELHHLVNDEALARHLSRVPWPFRQSDARAIAAKGDAPRYPQFVITLPDRKGDEGGAQVIGTVGFVDCGAETEMAYWIGRKSWNQGFATEAASAALSVARTLGHRRIHASHFIDNHANGRVLHKLGFKPTGQVRLRYSAARGGADLAKVHALDLSPPASDPIDPEMIRRAA
jgi:RimJ/RimL family protein N-acetyltransferase